MRISSHATLVAFIFAAFLLPKSTSAQTSQRPDNTNSPSVYSAGEGVVPPVVIHKVPPEYSEEALKAKYEGVCMVELTVDTHGMPSDVHVTHPIGMGLDEKAMEAVRQYRFKPGLRGGKPVAINIRIAVSFRLSQGSVVE